MKCYNGRVLSFMSMAGYLHFRPHCAAFGSHEVDFPAYFSQVLSVDGEHSHHVREKGTSGYGEYCSFCSSCTASVKISYSGCPPAWQSGPKALICVHGMSI